MESSTASANRRTVRDTNYPFPTRDFASRQEWAVYAGWLARHVRVSTALLPEPPAAPLRAKLLGRWEGDGFSCQKVAFEALPEVLVTGNLYRSAKTSRRGAKNPGILCPHGHWDDGRLHDHDPAGSVPARCIQFARMGITVFSWDMVGYNDSSQLGPDRSSHGADGRFAEDAQ